MSDKIPYSKVSKKSIPSGSSQSSSPSIKSENKNAGKGDKPRHNMSTYSKNYDEINW